MPHYSITCLEKLMVKTTYHHIKADTMEEAIGRVKAGLVAYDNHRIEDTPGEFIRVIESFGEEELEDRSDEQPKPSRPAQYNEFNPPGSEPPSILPCILFILAPTLVFAGVSLVAIRTFLF